MKKSLSYLAILIAILLLVFSFTSCEEEGYSITAKVAWNTKGGSTIETTVGSIGDSIEEPAKPTRDGYTFDGWYSMEDFEEENKVTFPYKLVGNVTFYAKWVEDAENNILIKTVADLLAFRDAVNAATEDAPYPTKPVVLMNDLNLSEIADWEPIGTSTRGEAINDGNIVYGKPFKGVFDGNGKTISNLKITTGTKAKGIGLFSAISGDETVVKNLTVTGSINVAANEQAGLIVGLIEKGAIIDNCKTYGNVNVKRGNGGIAGRIISNGAIKNSTNYANISGTGANVGGLVGAVYYGKAEGAEFFGVYNSENNGTVTGTSYDVGGIVGFSAGEVEIIGSTNNGAVSGNGNAVGGITGEAQHGVIIDDCSNTAAVKNTAGMGTGGLVGWIRYSQPDTYDDFTSVVTVKNSTNSGDVSGNSHVGGAIGSVYWAASFKDVVTSGSVTSTGTQTGGFAGGLQSLTKDVDEGGDSIAKGDKSYSATRDNTISFVNCAAQTTDGNPVEIDTNTTVKGTFIGHHQAAYSNRVFTNCLPGKDAVGAKASGYNQDRYDALEMN